MNKIEINLASVKPRRDLSLNVLITLSFLLAIFTIYNAYSYFNNRQTIEKLDVRMKALVSAGQIDMRTGKEPAQADAKDAEQLKRKVEFINRIIARKVFSWSWLLTELEKRSPDGLYLIQISPDFSGQKIAVSGVARSMNEVLQLVDRMSSSGSLKDVYLVKHSEPEKSGATKTSINTPANTNETTIVFNISAGYVGGEGL